VKILIIFSRKIIPFFARESEFYIVFLMMLFKHSLSDNGFSKGFDVSYAQPILELSEGRSARRD
jgi:hypothetical protein